MNAIGVRSWLVAMGFAVLGVACASAESPSTGRTESSEGALKMCSSDKECRTFSDYCTGCDCRALGVDEPDPICPGPGVHCLIDPCWNQVAFCDHGRCALRPTM